jgi:hypothetical protein
MTDVTEQMRVMFALSVRRAYLAGIVFGLGLFAGSLWWKYFPNWLSLCYILLISGIGIWALTLFIRAYRCQFCGGNVDVEEAICAKCGRTYQ